MKRNEQERSSVQTQPAAGSGSRPASGDRQERMRRNLLHLAAGVYLLYLTYRLGYRFVTEIGVKGWNGDMILSNAGAVVFLLTGGFLLVSCIRRMLREHEEDKDKKNAPEGR